MRKIALHNKTGSWILPGKQEWLDPVGQHNGFLEVFGQNGVSHVHQDDTMYRSEDRKENWY